jgi:hypothetical protein
MHGPSQGQKELSQDAALYSSAKGHAHTSQHACRRRQVGAFLKPSVPPGETSDHPRASPTGGVPWSEATNIQSCTWVRPHSRTAKLRSGKTCSLVYTSVYRQLFTMFTDIHNVH